MSFRLGNIAVIAEEPDGICAFCKNVTELRPYGPKGEKICYNCAMKDEQGTIRRMKRVLFGVKEVD